MPMRKFHAGIFGAPGRVKGVTLPMDSSITALGRVTMYDVFSPGNPAEAYAEKRPVIRRATARPRVVTSPILPPRVIGPPKNFFKPLGF